MAKMFTLYILMMQLYITAWKVSKYEPEITPYLDTFHAVHVIKISVNFGT